MSCQVDSRELRRFVVRIDGAEGRVLGTGFFVAPGYVLTCAHVIGDADAARVVPADQRVTVGDEPWVVTARSAGPAAGTGALWPFPDLAVLRARSEVDHPCAYLEPRDPAGDCECHAWGYARREEGIPPIGSPAAFGFEGVEGDGFLRLRLGQAAPGLSGAPLVCPSRRAVIGVITATRDPRSDLGGWASPVAALLAGSASAPGELGEHGALILEANKHAAMRFRRVWNAVLPLEMADALARPWAQFARGPRSTPAQLLRADYGVVRYMFRESELDAAVAWCAEAGWGRSRMAIQRLAAGAGAGKSRFAIELCKRMEELGWVAGLWRGDAVVAHMRLPRLVVLDYAEEIGPVALDGVLEGLSRHADGMAPVRVLLLTRLRPGGIADPLDALEMSASAALADILATAEDNRSASSALSPDQRAELFAEAAACFADAWHGPGASAAAVRSRPVPDLSGDHYGTALDVLFEALDYALGEDAAGQPARPSVSRVLAHEQRYWRAAGPPADVDSDLLRDCVALVTMAGAGDDAEAHELLSLAAPLAGLEARPARQRLIGWLAALYEGQGRLNPLRPDRLGEALVAAMLRAQSGQGLNTIAKALRLTSDDQVLRCLEVLARLCSYDEAVARTVATVIAAAHEPLTERAERRAHGQPGRPGRIALAGALVGILTPRVCSLIDQEVTGAWPASIPRRRSLSVSYDRLGELAEQAGQGERGWQLFGHGLAVRRALAAADPGKAAYQRDLSVSFDRLGDHARQAGQSERARELYEQGLAITRELANADPRNSTHQRDLAVCCNKLANLARQSGQAARATELYEQGLAIRRALAAADPGNATYQRDLSVSYNKLADVARLAGRGERARELYEQGLAIRRELAAAEPGNATYQRDLSVSCDRLADLAREAGQRSRARELYEQGLAIRRELAWAEPGNTTYQRDLAVSYDRLGDLARQADDSGGARTLYEQSLAITAALTEAEPGNTTYQRDLAVCFERLADMAARGNDGPAATGLLARAIEIRRALARAEPARLDLSEELAYVLYFAATRGAQEAGRRNETADIISLLEPFERAGQMSRRAAALLAWARSVTFSNE